jgi:membrane protein
MNKIKSLWQILKDAGSSFLQQKVLKYSASLSFYTIFAIGPMLLVIIYISSLFWGRQAIEGTVHDQISGLIGDAAAFQIQEIIKNASVSHNNYMAIVGILTLAFAATTVFTQIQDTINTIWNLKVKKGKGWEIMIKRRLLSFSIVAGLGLLLLLSLLFNSLMEGFMSRLQDLFPQMAIIIIYLVNQIITFLVVAFLFGFIYKVLPDAMLQWKDVSAGALFASLLFMIGKFCITFYINHSNIASTYGSAGSLVILLLWIYYSASILYFGAEFTKAWALRFGAEIKPKEYAVTIQVVVIESNERSVQQNEQNTDIADKIIHGIKEFIKKR